MPSFFHNPCDSPRSPYERHNTRARAPRDAYNAMAPPARQTKSAACALTTNNRSFDKSMLAPANQTEKWLTGKGGMGSGEWGIGNEEVFSHSHSPLPIPHSPLPIFLSPIFLSDIF